MEGHREALERSLLANVDDLGGLQINHDELLPRKLWSALVKFAAGYVCERCGAKEPLTSHHVDGDKTNNRLSNGECLCRPCHNDEHYGARNGSKTPFLLDLGCGERPFEDGRGWVHLDERPLDDVEIVGRIEDLAKLVKANSVDEILARHVLEHFSHRDTAEILGTWLSRLKPGGKLRIEVPNFSWQCNAFSGAVDREGKSQEELIVMAYGDQDYPGNFHKTGFTETTLYDALDAAGFVNVNTMDIGMVVVAEAERSTDG